MRMGIKPGDIILALAVTCLSAALAIAFASGRNAGNATAVVARDGKEIAAIRLGEVGEPYTFEVNGAYRDVIAVEPGRIRFSDADCPDRSCVHMGWIGRPGQSAACLPNRTVIRITGGGSEVDEVAD